MYGPSFGSIKCLPSFESYVFIAENKVANESIAGFFIFLPYDASVLAQ